MILVVVVVKVVGGIGCGYGCCGGGSHVDVGE